MSFFNWFSGKSGTGKDVSGTARPDDDSSGGGRDKASVPMPLRSAANAANAAESGSARKSHRHAKRELLYTAVREAMIRAGVLSASYKFKVLSLDPRGDQFMVMMDLAQEFGGQTERLAEMEVMIAQGAKSRYNIRVTAVYWRMNELVSIGRPKPSGPPGGSRAPQAAPVAGLAEPARAGLKPVARYEPIQDDEVAAFKQALAAASVHGAGAVAVAADKGAAATRSRSYTLLTGFEDTEMAESPALVPALSATQYGDLN